MRKIYPYLKENYYSIESQAVQQRNFLSQIDDFVNQKQYVKITLLDWQERPLQEITGEIVSGSITKDGASAVRRTLNLSCTLDTGSYNIDNLKSNFSINKKIYVEVGIKNYTKSYMDPSDPENYFPILWFPQGVFFIGQLSVSASTSNLNLTISGKDKMCKLNGDIGGKFPATIIFNKVDVVDINGNVSTADVKIYDIIQECVNHYGEEDLNNIIIKDVPLQIKQVMSWNSSIPIYGYYQTDEVTQQNQSYILTYNENDVPADVAYQQYNRGDDVGYVYTDFVWTGQQDLVAAPGESITSILDKIKSMLGNYEYFYDVYGIFHFQEIKNYLNTTLTKKVTDILENQKNINNVLDQLNEEDYIIETNVQKSVYNFTDNKNLTQLSVNPQYENIRNDYIVLGETDGDIKSSVRYHLAIDNKPDTSVQYNTPMICYERAGDRLKILDVPVKIDIDNISLSDQLAEKYGNLSNYQNSLITQKNNGLIEIENIQKEALNNAFQIYANQLTIPSDESVFFSLKNEYFGYEITITDNKMNVIIQNGGCNYINGNLLDEDEGNTWYEKYLNHIEKCREKTESLIIIPRKAVEARYKFLKKVDSADTSLDNHLTYWDNTYSSLINDENEAYQLALLEIALFNIMRNIISNNSIINNNKINIDQINKSLENLDFLKTELKQKQFEVIIDLLIKNELLPQTGNTEIIYYCNNLFDIDENNNFNTRIYFYWNNNRKQYELINYIKEYPNGYQTDNWQTHLYIMGLINRNLAKDSSQYQNIEENIKNSSFNVSSTLGKTINADYYFEELNAFWPLVFDFELNDYYGSNADKQSQDNKIENLEYNKTTLENNLIIAKKIKNQAENQYKGFSTYLFKLQDMQNSIVSTINNTTLAIKSKQNDYQLYTYNTFIDNPEKINSNVSWIFDLYDIVKKLLTFFNTDCNYNLITSNSTRKLPKDWFTSNSLLIRQEQIDSENSTTYKIYRKLWRALKNLEQKNIDDTTEDSESFKTILKTWIKTCPYRIGNIQPETVLESFSSSISNIDQQITWFNGMLEYFDLIDEQTLIISSVLIDTYLLQQMFDNTNEQDDLKRILAQSAEWVNNIKNCIKNLNIIKSLYEQSLDLSNQINYLINECYTTENKNYFNNLIIKENLIFNNGNFTFDDLLNYSSINQRPNQYFDSIKNKTITIEDITSKWSDSTEIGDNIVSGTLLEVQYSTKNNPTMEDYKEWLDIWINLIKTFYNNWKERYEYWTTIINTLNSLISKNTQNIVKRKLEQYSTLYDGEYYLDFIDPKTSNIGEFCVSNIGRRQLVEKDTNINCLFDVPVPNVIFINTNTEDAAKQREKAESNGLIWSQINQEIYQNFTIGGWKNPAWERITSDLYLHTTYQKTVSMTALPAFYLEPNSRVTINDRSTQTYGDYNITSINIPLGAGQLMSVSGSEISQQR